MEKKYMLTLLMISFILFACTPKYYKTKDDPNRISYLKDVKKYYHDNLSPIEENRFYCCLEIANQLFVGMFPFLFDEFTFSLKSKDLLEKTDCLESLSEKYSTVEKGKDYNGVKTFISFFTQPILLKKGEKSLDKKFPNKKETKPQNKKNYHVQFVVSSYLYSFEPAHRIEKVYTLIIPLKKNVEFVSVGEIKKPVSVQFAKEEGQSITLEGSEIPLFSILDKIKVTPTFAYNLKREITRSFATLNAEISPLRNFLLISQDGGPASAEIRGNATVNVSFKDLDYKARDKKNAKINALVASIVFVRYVERGQRTVKEDDDKIKYLVFKSLLITNLVP